MSAKLIHIPDSCKLFRKLFDYNPDIAKPVQSARSVGFLNPTALSISISNAKKNTCQPHLEMLIFGAFILSP